LNSGGGGVSPGIVTLPPGVLGSGVGVGGLGTSTGGATGRCIVTKPPGELGRNLLGGGVLVRGGGVTPGTTMFTLEGGVLVTVGGGGPAARARDTGVNTTRAERARTRIRDMASTSLVKPSPNLSGQPRIAQRGAGSQ